MARKPYRHLITIITLERAGGQTGSGVFVGLVRGRLTVAQRKAIARKYELSDEDGAMDVISFLEMPMPHGRGFNGLWDVRGYPGVDTMDADDLMTPEEKVARKVHEE